MVGGSSRTAPPSRPSPRSATRRRSGCARRARRRPPRSPAGPRARRRPAASAPRAARSPAAAERLARVGGQRDALARQLRRSPDARERHREDRAHARAHRLRRVRVGAAGPERHARGAERRAPSAAPCRRCPGRRRRAGRRTAAPRAGPSAARRRAITRVPEPSVRDARQRARLTSWKPSPPRPEPGEAVALERRRARRCAAAAMRSSPSARNVPAARALALVCRRRSAFRRGFCGRRCWLTWCLC